MNTVTDFAFSYIGNNYIQPFLWLTDLPVACIIIVLRYLEMKILCAIVFFTEQIHEKERNYLQYIHGKRDIYSH